MEEEVMASWLLLLLWPPRHSHRFHSLLHSPHTPSSIAGNITSHPPHRTPHSPSPLDRYHHTAYRIHCIYLYQYAGLKRMVIALSKVKRYYRPRHCWLERVSVRRGARDPPPSDGWARRRLWWWKVVEGVLALLMMMQLLAMMMRVAAAAAAAHC